MIDDPNPPQDCYLVIVKELAERLSGFPHENQFSLKHKPWFEFQVIHRFRRTDFVPAPRVNAVLWRIKRRDHPLISLAEKERYWNLIEQGIGGGEPIKFNFRRIFGRESSSEICRRLNIDPNTKPSYLSLDKWIELHKYLALASRDPRRG